MPWGRCVIHQECFGLALIAHCASTCMRTERSVSGFVLSVVTFTDIDVSQRCSRVWYGDSSSDVGRAEFILSCAAAGHP